MTSEAAKGDGSLVLNHTSRVGGHSGGDVGASCRRTFHDIKTGHLDTEIGLDQTHSFIQLTVPSRETKLEPIARGSAQSNPSFKVNFRVSGSCSNMGVSPSAGEDDGFLPGLSGTPRRAGAQYPHQSLSALSRAVVRAAALP